jgi:hypothetical protein
MPPDARRCPSMHLASLGVLLSPSLPFDPLHAPRCPRRLSRPLDALGSLPPPSAYLGVLPRPSISFIPLDGPLRPPRPPNTSLEPLRPPSICPDMLRSASVCREGSILRRVESGREGWLFDWSIGRLVDWSVGRLVGWSIGCFIVLSPVYHLPCGPSIGWMDGMGGRLCVWVVMRRGEEGL